MKDSFFSKKNKRLITDPFDGQNPITVQVLGICSALGHYSSIATSSNYGSICCSCYDMW